MKFVLKKSINDKERKRFSSYPDLTAKLLLDRKIKDEKSADIFLNPKYETFDPFLFEDMEKVAQRIIKAIKNKEKILIFSDYDADGIPGAVLFSDFLKKAGGVFEVFIPNRGLDGFGLNKKAIQKAKDENFSLIITIDCGINDIEEAKMADEAGIDLIITDHHEPPKEGLPKTFGIIDAKIEDSKYKDKNLCGTGVIFKVVEGVLKKERFGLNIGAEKWFLDLVAIATIADQVPLLGENRVFSSFGLKVLRKTKRVGLLELFNRLKIKAENVNEDDISFSLAPRINASSRMGNPLVAYQLLFTESKKEAVDLADTLDEMNEKRKLEVALMIKEIKNHLKTKEKKNFIITGHSKWRPSLLGLAAGMIAEEERMPVFLWGKDEDFRIKGSFRSDGSFDVLTAVRKSEAVKLFDDFGGHSLAGGFSVSDENIHFLEGHLEGALGNSLLVDEKNGKEKMVEADFLLTVEDLNMKLWNEIEKFAPFGMGNRKPIFLLERARVASFKKFGKSGNHISFNLIGETGSIFPVIVFFGESKFSLRDDDVVRVVGTLEKSYFNGSAKLRMRVLDAEKLKE